MTTPDSIVGQLVAGGIRINVTGPGGFAADYDLPPGDALVVGTSPACGVRIEGPDIAAMHCTFSCEGGLLVIDDWDTGGGTYLDGQRIARQATVEPGATVQIGSYRFITHSTGDAFDSSHDDPTQGISDSDGEQPVEDEEVFAAEQAMPSARDEEWAAPFAHGRETDDSEEGEDLQEIERRTTDFDDAYDVYDSTDEDFAAYDPPDVATPAYARGAEVATDEMAELLKIEIEYLRTELADRDARLEELERSPAQAGGGDADLPTRQEVETLAGRLEDLLEELDHSDERMKTMSELLRVSEEANVAAIEERVQTEAWMGEVERRVRDWESEWHAERDSMQRRITDLTAQRDEAEARGGSRENTELIQSLRRQLSQFEAETQRLQNERDEMQHRLQNADVASVEERIEKAVNEAMREERLHLSQERAEVARERAALLKQQEELAAQPASLTTSADIADLKIRAFREHLREVRSKEPEHRPPPSMSQRLGKLWRKLDGRPLDTD